MDDVIYREGQQPDPVTLEHPLEGLETEVLRVWSQERHVKEALKQNPQAVHEAVRRAVFDALRQEAELKAQGLYTQEAQEFTRPAMWLAPAFPTP
jgi:hypothetical protein